MKLDKNEVTVVRSLAERQHEILETAKAQMAEIEKAMKRSRSRG